MWQVWVENNGDSYAYGYYTTEDEAKAEKSRVLNEGVDSAEVLFVG
ncbi:MAG: hypothetical protein WC420_04275 [Candidatus Paceibacterota bacterium]|jgi:hypothetical protein